MDVKAKTGNAHRPSTAAPPCPRCGGDMVLRTPWGARIGESFWGCSNYPRCYGTFNIDQV
jgi:restriction system protein